MKRAPSRAITLPDEVADFDHQFACVASVLVFEVIGSMKNS